MADHRLERATSPPYGPHGWHLLDAEDGVRIHSGSLDQIEAWLNS